MHTKHRLADLIQLYLQHLETNQASTAHREKTAWHLKPLQDQFADVEPQSLTRLDMTRFMQSLKRVDGEPFSDATKTGFVTALRGLFKWCVEQRVLTENPADHLKRKGYGARESRVANPEHVAAVCEHLELYAQRRGNHPADVRDAFVVSFSMDSGARLGEIHNLLRRSFIQSLERPIDTIYGNVYRIESHGKTGSVTLRFSDRTAKLGRLWLELAPPTSSPRLLVSLTNGQPLSKYSVSKAFDRMCQFVEVPIFRSHAVRHLNVTKLMQLRVDDKVVSSYANHSTPTVTTTVYRHLASGEVDVVAAELMQERSGRSQLADVLFKRVER